MAKCIDIHTTTQKKCSKSDLYESEINKNACKSLSKQIFHISPKIYIRILLRYCAKCMCVCVCKCIGHCIVVVFDFLSLFLHAFVRVKSHVLETSLLSIRPARVTLIRRKKKQFKYKHWDEVYRAGNNIWECRWSSTFKPLHFHRFVTVIESLNTSFVPFHMVKISTLPSWGQLRLSRIRALHCVRDNGPIECY